MRELKKVTKDVMSAELYGVEVKIDCNDYVVYRLSCYGYEGAKDREKSLEYHDVTRAFRVVPCPHSNKLESATRRGKAAVDALYAAHKASCGYDDIYSGLSYFYTCGAGKACEGYILEGK